MVQNDENSAMVIYGFYENFYRFYEDSVMVIYGFYENCLCWLFILAGMRLGKMHCKQGRLNACSGRRCIAMLANTFAAAWARLASCCT